MSIENTTLEAPAVPQEGAQPAAEAQHEVSAESKGQAQPAKADSIRTPENAETLRKMLRREKEDPNVKFTEKELDLYDAYTAGKLKPAKRTKAAEPKPEADGEEAAPEETEAPETKEEAEDAEEESPEEEEGEDTPAPDPEAEALMKEVGAKSLKDALSKVKELRAKLGGKDAQTVAKLEKQMKSEQALWSDLAKGVPDAVDFVKQHYGLSLARPGQAKVSPEPQAAAEPARPGGKRGYISEDAFIDPESAKMVNDILRQRDQEIDELRGTAQSFTEERERIRQESIQNKAKLTVIDEMVQIAQRMDPLKGIGNLREAIASWYETGKPDSRLEVFNELFEIASREGCNLQAASAIKRGMEAERLITEAEERGRRAAYGHKPNPSLSGSQGGKGEMNYQQLTDAQLEAMSEDHKLMPDDWFDRDERPVKSKIPKKAWKIFGFV